MAGSIKTIEKKDFPKRLREIPDLPEKLFIRGELPPEDHKWLCVVGSRKYSNYGKEACEKLIAGLRGYPIIIVSGLALGMDAIAHQVALSAGLKTVAVPGSGIDDSVLYPMSNRQLARKILEHGGCLLSEFEPDFRATAWGFPQRNRIMAGLSDAVLVIEAEIKSGTLITSRLATDYNRDVFTVPGSIFSKTSEGPHMLLGLGATPIASSGDLLKALGLKVEKSVPEKNAYADCSAKEREVLEFLKEPRARDEVTRALSLSASEANTLLGILEIKGFIKESMGELHRA